jgi:hypothetical protein
LTGKINVLAKADEDALRLQKIPGIHDFQRWQRHCFSFITNSYTNYFTISKNSFSQLNRYFLGTI